jgi:hypothetical protein
MGKAAAHEFGHFLGLYDEYSGGVLGPYGVQADGVMGGCLDKSVQPRYFEQILTDIIAYTERGLWLNPVPGFLPTDSTIPDGAVLFAESHLPPNAQTVDEPSPWSLLVATSLAAIWFARRKTRRNVKYQWFFARKAWMLSTARRQR